MASTPDNLYVTYVDVDRDLLKIWGQRHRIGATYIERQLLQLLPEFNRSLPPDPLQIHKGTFCFAKYTDDNYCRARVLARLPGDLVSVLFVDYGNRDVIKLSNIRIQEGNEGDVLSKMSEQAEEYYLARVGSPTTGWTKEIVNEIRRDICYEEVPYKVTAQVGDQKIIEVKFRNEDLSNYLVEKQLASNLSLPVQRQIILSYCSLVSNEMSPDSAFRDIPRVNFSTSVPPPNMTVLARASHAGNNGMMHGNFGKGNHSVGIDHHLAPRHLNSLLPHLNQNVTKNTYLYPGGHINSQMPVSASPAPPVNSVLNNHMNSLNNLKENEASFHNNKDIIQLLAQQVKQYISENDAKTESEGEKTPHHYINSVLEVENTYNVLVSFIDDGPWSFSIQLLASEAELRKLMDELSSTELVPIKPPIILGHPCIASSALYGNLCRGVVVSISRSAVKVYFVDFGNTEDLPYSSIFELPPKFFKIRVLSQKFSLSGLQKVAYSDDIKKFFKEVVHDEYLMLRVTSLEGDNLPTCELFLKNINIKRIVNEKIRELRNASQEYFPKPGDIELVVVTWVVSPQKFFVHLHKRDADLKALKAELAEVQTKGLPLTYKELSVGFKCVCLYEADGYWYRAVITSVDSENEIAVFYVDYGNTEIVRISLLRKIESPGLITQISNQAIQCSLKGFENKPVDKELTSKLESMVLEKEVQMSIVSSEKELLCVRLNDNGKDISELLLEANSPKINMLDTYSVSKDDVWISPKSMESNWTASFDRERKALQNGELYEKNHNFRDDKTSFDGKDNWRNGLKSDSSKSRNLKQDRQNDDRNWKPEKNRGPKPGRDEWDSNSQRFDRSRGFKEKKNRDGERNQGRKETRGRDIWEDKKENNFREKREQDENRGGGRFDERKYTREGREGRRFERNRDYWDSSGGGDGKRKVDRNECAFSGSDKPKRLRKPIRKEDTVPPGSKFEEKVLHIGDCERGIVTYYFSPHEFFVQLLSQEEDFKKMMKDIQIYYKDKYSIRDSVQAGDIVIAQFSVDKVLYRAEVIKPSPVTVRYVDYGNQEPVGPKSIWLMDKQFLNLPKQVIKCKLSNLMPHDAYWPPPGSAVDKFFEKPEFNFTVLGIEQGIFEVSMEDVDRGKDVASEIIEAGLGRPTAPELDIPEIDYSLLPNQILKLYVTHVESPSQFYVVLNPKALEILENEINRLTQDKKSLIPLQRDMIKPQKLCLATNDHVSWSRGKIVKIDGNKILVWFCDRGDTVELSPDKLMALPDYVQRFQPQVVQCFLNGSSHIPNNEFKKIVEHKNHLLRVVSVTGESMSVVLYDEDGQKLSCQKDGFPHCVEPISHLPVLSQKIPVVISHIEGPKEIYVQLSSNNQKLDNFSELMTSFYSEDKEGFDIEGNGMGGSLVAAKSVVYQIWYRGRLVSSSENGLEVFYVDFGNKEILPRENVKKLDPSFLSLSAFSSKLALDVEFNTGDIDEIVKKILDFCEPKDPLAYFKRDGTELISEFIVDEKRMTQVLKSSGLVTVNHVDSFEEILSCKKTQFALEENTNNKEIEFQNERKVGNLFTVYIIYSQGPYNFYVQRETSTDDLNKVTEALLEAPKFKSATCIDRDTTYAAKFSDDGIWYRARILNKYGKEVEVHFIDYGNKSIVEEVKILPCEASCLMNIPDLAESCCLAYGDKNDRWSDAAIEKFSEYADGRELKMEIVGRQPQRSVVRLYHEGKSITDELESLCECDGRTPVYISHVESPLHFYIQYVDDDKYKIIADKLETEICEIIQEPEVGMLYQARFVDDNCWYRAKIVGYVIGGYRVFFIDFGNTSVSTEFKKLPADIEDITPRAIPCSLDIPKEMLTERKNIKEEFISLTGNGVPVLQALIITPGDDINIISLKLDGKIIEDYFNQDMVLDESSYAFSDLTSIQGTEFPETDDGKNSKKHQNETDEEKRVRNEGFKSDDEKSTNPSEEFWGDEPNGRLIEENWDKPNWSQDEEEENWDKPIWSQDEEEENWDKPKVCVKECKTDAIFKSEVPKNHLVVNGCTEREETIKKHGMGTKNKVHKIVTGSVSRGEGEVAEFETTKPVPTHKQEISEKVVPENISRGVSPELVAKEDVLPVEFADKDVSRSTPKTSQLNHSQPNYVKLDLNDRVVPGCISTGITLNCSRVVEKIPGNEKIIPEP